MKNLLCLAMSFGFICIFYLYIRNRLSVIDARLNTLTDIVHTLASEFSTKEKNLLTELNLDSLPENEVESSGSESDSDESDDSESECESEPDDLSVELIKVTEPLFPKVIKQEPLNIEYPKLVKENQEKQESIELTLDSPPVDLIEVSDDEDTSNNVKRVNIELPDYSALSVKELKQKVSELGGPASLKTKKLLIEFLEKKV